MTRASLIFLVFALLLSACSAAPPVRSQKVGRAERLYFDSTRSHWIEDGPRPLRSTLWYPTDSSEPEEAWVIGGDLFPLFKAGWSVPDAELSARRDRYPLIVLSHGTGGATAQLSWLAEALAASGYIAASVNHHGNTAIEAGTPHGFFLWWERALDLQRLIDRILEDELFGDRIDLDRIGAAGHSLGGYTVLALAGARVDLDQIEQYCATRPKDPNCELPPEAPFSREDLIRGIETDERMRASMERHRLSYREPRVQAVSALAPAAGMALTERSLGEISIPILIVVGDRDEMTPPASNGQRIADLIPKARFELLEGVRHYSFLAECGSVGRIAAGPLCVEEVGRSRRRIHQDVAGRLGQFFDEHLARSGAPR